MSAVLSNDVDILVQKHLPFVHFILKKYYPPTGFDYDDLYQVGCIGLFRAAKKFDPSLGFKFTTYAAHWIENELKKAIRAQNAVKRTGVVVSMESAYSEEDNTLMDLMATFDSVEGEVEASLLFDELVKTEPKITRLALQGYTQREIGEKLGISQVQVSRKMRGMKNAIVALC